MVKPLQLKMFFAVILLFTASCGSPASTPTATFPTTFSGPDKEMAAAVQQAQKTLYILRRALLAPEPSYVFLGVKVRFTSPNGDIEDMWTAPAYIWGDRYTVYMIEGVTAQTGAHPDQLVEVRPEQILDWMIKEKDGTVLGGYTLRVEFKRLTPEQQKEYLKATGYKFQ